MSGRRTTLPGSHPRSAPCTCAGHDPGGVGDAGRVRDTREPSRAKYSVTATRARWRARGAFVGETVLWAGITFGVWLTTLSAITGPELVLGGAVSAGCGVVAAAARRALRGAWGLHLRWLASARWLPVAVLADSASVLWSALRGDGGTFERVRVAGTTGSRSATAGRRAAYVLLVSASPGSVVLDLDPDTGLALVHRVGSRGPAMERRAAG